MGIVNRTPDSFFDGGLYLDDNAARARAEQLIGDGADIVDVGGESTRPGAPAVSAAEQIARLGDIIPHVVALGAVASVDTTSATVAAHAIGQGARIINSVSLDAADELGAVAARAGVDLVLAHCRGSMTAMSGFSTYRDDGYEDVIEDVVREWEQAAHRARATGLPRQRLIFDPGLGFTKNASQSLALCAGLATLKARLGGVRVLVGASRKSYVAMTVAGQLGGALPPPARRLGGSIAAVLDAAAGGADIVRVHDVADTAQALAYAAAVGQRRAVGGMGHSAERAGTAPAGPGGGGA